jgi:DNA primase
MDAVEEIKSRLSIEDVVSEYVQLKRAGRNFKGLSPFTAERTPSFMVSPEKGIWHDFSSGKGGNVFSFVMEMEGLDFKAALELLARKANVDLAQYRTGQGAETGKQKERLFEALEKAAHFYQRQFKGSQTALEYVFKKRAFTKEVALVFRIGYSPNTGGALIDFLRQQGFTDKELSGAGLTARRYRGGVQDMFRGRLMIPLMDPQGRVIGFTARLLADEPDAPKYINTPQTPLYDKSRHVYGLHLAKEALRREQYAVLVEGNLDVIASHQAGVFNVVATAGTALTEMHLKGLSRFTSDIRLAFDQDKAGQTAAERAIPIASKVGVSLSMITIPEGKDPDELVKKNPDLWRQVIAKPQYALDWLIERYQSQLDISSAQGKRQFSDVLLKVVRQLDDEVEQDHYLTKIAEITNVSKAALTNKLSGIEATAAAPRRKGKVTPVRDTRQFEARKLQNHYLCLVLMRPGLRSYLDYVVPEIFVTETGAEVFRYLRDNPDFDGSADAQKVFFRSSEVKNLQDYVKMLVLQYETEYQEIDDTELGYSVAGLRTRLVRQYVETKKADIRIAMEQKPEAEATLLGEIQKLDILLKFTEEHS